ncbi:hypothetical protein E4U53_000741 [Claviceps sorghi]|nr:hypothetical protein E4U53_000741 [Claviceps sorghi]
MTQQRTGHEDLDGSQEFLGMTLNVLEDTKLLWFSGPAVEEVWVMVLMPVTQRQEQYLELGAD